MSNSDLRIIELLNPSVLELTEIKALFILYQEELVLDLGFQGFEKELKNLPRKYNGPEACILVAKFQTKIIGIVALQQLDKKTCEMKRLFVLKQYRRKKVAQKLVESLIEIARKKHYEIMKLDTLERLKPARDLYETIGFKPTEAYNYNPDKSVLYYALQLS